MGRAPGCEVFNADGMNGENWAQKQVDTVTQAMLIKTCIFSVLHPNIKFFDIKYLHTI
jgi:hypothetical protein